MLSYCYSGISRRRPTLLPTGSVYGHGILSNIRVQLFARLDANRHTDPGAVAALEAPAFCARADPHGGAVREADVASEVAEWPLWSWLVGLGAAGVRVLAPMHHVDARVISLLASEQGILTANFGWHVERRPEIGFFSSSFIGTVPLSSSKVMNRFHFRSMFTFEQTFLQIHSFCTRERRVKYYVSPPTASP